MAIVRVARARRPVHGRLGRLGDGGGGLWSEIYGFFTDYPGTGTTFAQATAPSGVLYDQPGSVPSFGAGTENAVESAVDTYITTPATEVGSVASGTASWVGNNWTLIEVAGLVIGGLVAIVLIKEAL